jgi:hypothetical protein
LIARQRFAGSDQGEQHQADQHPVAEAAAARRGIEGRRIIEWTKFRHGGGYFIAAYGLA